MSKLIVEMEMPTRCTKCGVRLKCKRYVFGLQQDIAEDLKPLMGDRDCLIKVVLPEEHGDLIDRQDAIKEFEPYAEYESNRRNADWVKRIKAVLNSMTAVIAAERR